MQTAVLKVSDVYKKLRIDSSWITRTYSVLCNYYSPCPDAIKY
jgi:hypothetical protein